MRSVLAVYLFCEISASRWLQALLSHSHHGLDLILRGFIISFFFNGSSTFRRNWVEVQDWKWRSIEAQG